MKSLKILRLLLQDAERTFCSLETERDWNTIQSRFEHEGLSFLTITLPTFSSWLEQSLEARQVLPTIFSTFRRKGGREHLSLPAFLLGLTERVFDRLTGLIRSDADPSAVYFIRQICSFFKKVKLPCSRERAEETVEKFKETDRRLPKRIVLDSIARSVANVVIKSLRYSEGLAFYPSFPKHGPGATVEKLWGNQKFTKRQYYTRWMGAIDIEELYGVQPLQDGYDTIEMISVRDELACKLSLVPKTLKAPRTIAVEPVAMQYAQQLVSSRLIAAMGRSAYTKHIKFNDQSVNNLHAKEGSHHGDQSTIDLSEASDRISSALVREIVRADPDLRRQLFAVRSSRIQIRQTDGKTTRGGVLNLRKFSTSGSAVTFPVETLVFFVLVLSVLVRDHYSHRRGSVRLEPRSESSPAEKAGTRGISRGGSLIEVIHRLSQRVSVFGDDIVVPRDSCESVCSYLETLGLKVNRGKTFYRGNFRESCGGDYFMGEDVTPKYLRRLLPRTLRDGESLASAVSTSNQLYKAGCWLAADGIRRMVDSITKLPLVKATSPGLGWHTFKQVYSFTRRRNAYGEFVVPTYALKAKAKTNRIDGYDALLKALISPSPFEDEDHLLTSVPQYSATLRRVMVTPY